MYYNRVGKLASLFRHLPLPAEHYYYHKNAVVSLVSLGRICEEFREVFDSGIHDAFHIFNNDGIYIIFDKTRNNLYYLSVFDSDVQECCFVTMVAGVEMEYLGLGRRRAKAVRSLQKKIGFSSDNDLANATNCKSIAELKGKSTK